MGYTTYFDGQIMVSPPLNQHEINFLVRFSHTRRVARHKGPYFCSDLDNFGQNAAEDVIAHNYSSTIEAPETGTPAVMPGLWCHWVPNGEGYSWSGNEDAMDRDGTYLAWDGGEKFYDSVEWMEYIIDNFLRPGAFASTEKGQELVRLAGEEETFSHFTFDHVCFGVIYAEGEESDDRWRLVVDDNKVEQQSPTVIWPKLPEHL